MPMVATCLCCLQLPLRLKACIGDYVPRRLCAYDAYMPMVPIMPMVPTCLCAYEILLFCAYVPYVTYNAYVPMLLMYCT